MFTSALQSGFSGGQRDLIQAVTEATEKVLRKRGTSFQKIQGRICAGFSSKTGNFVLIITPKADYVDVKIRLKENLPQDKFELVAEFMARVNFSKHLSRGFCLDINDGEFALESSSPVNAHTNLEPLLQTTLDYSLVIWNRYMEYFQMMLKGEVTPAQAVELGDS